MSNFNSIPVEEYRQYYIKTNVFNVSEGDSNKTYSMFRSWSDYLSDRPFDVSNMLGTARMTIDADIMERIDRLTLSFPTLAKIRQNLGAENGYDTSKDHYILTLSKNSMFSKCLEWEGIFGYDTQIKTWIEDIWAINLND